MVMAVLSCGDIYYAVKRDSFCEAMDDILKNNHSIKSYHGAVLSYGAVTFPLSRKPKFGFFFQISNLVTFHNYHCSDSFCLSLQVASLVRDLRTELDRLLEKKIEDPSFDLASYARGSRVIDAIVQLITTQ